MTEHVRANSPADFLAVVPALAGFQPSNSLLIVPFVGIRSIGAMRLDLKALRQQRVIGDMLDHFERVDAVVTVVYTDEQIRPPEWSLNYQDEMVKARFNLEDRGYRVRDMLIVGRDAWASYIDGVRHSLDEIGAGVPIMNPPTASASDLAILPDVEVGPGIHDRIDRHERIVGAEAVGVIEDALTDHDDGLLSDLALVLQYPSTRDGAVLQWARGREWGMKSMVIRDAEDQSVLNAHVDLFTGLGPVPDVSRLHDALRAVKHVAAWLPEPERPPALSVAGWLAWALGMGSAAARLIDESMRIDPEYNFAFLLSKFVGTGTLPQWAFEKANQVGRDE